MISSQQSFPTQEGRQDSVDSFLSLAMQYSDENDDSDPFVKFTESWAERAAVKGVEPHLTEVFDPARPDFLESLLPFDDHPAYESAPPELKQQVLSCGWLAYNAKTIAIEAKIINPACLHVVEDDIPGIPGRTYREAASQAMVDEAYHILLTSNACDITRDRRGLDHVHLPQFDLVTRMQQQQDLYSEDWQRILVQMATAVVSELLVSDYLKLLSDSETVQPLNVLTTAIHRKDESAHNGLFKTLGSTIFHTLNSREKTFFLEMLSLPSQWFASPEFDVWRAMLQQIEFPHADQMIDDCILQADKYQTNLKLTSVERLLRELDLDPELAPVSE